MYRKIKRVVRNRLQLVSWTLLSQINLFKINLENKLFQTAKFI